MTPNEKIQAAMAEQAAANQAVLVAEAAITTAQADYAAAAQRKTAAQAALEVAVAEGVAALSAAPEGGAE